MFHMKFLFLCVYNIVSVCYLSYFEFTTQCLFAQQIDFFQKVQELQGKSL